MQLIKKLTICSFVAVSTIAASIPSIAAPNKPIAVSGTLKGASGYSVVLVGKSGQFKSAKLTSSGKFKLSGTASFLKDATLQLIDDSGRYFGPVVLARTGRKLNLALSGKTAAGEKVVKLGALNRKDGYATLKNAPDAIVVNAKRKITGTAQGAPRGAGKSGLIAAGVSSTKSLRMITASSSEEQGGDLDGDGIINALDVDDDGDLTLDSSDPESAATTANENPFTTLYVGLSQAINQNVGAGLTDEAIDAIVGGENMFNLIFFLPASQFSTPITGAHVRCGSALSYCRSTADGGGTAFYSGVSESDNAIKNQLWTNYNADGSGFPNLEPIRSGESYVAGIQPRVGTSEFRPGDVYQVEFMNGSTVVESKTMSLPPYFVSAPAISKFDAGSGEVDVNYSDISSIGMTNGNPIVLSGSGELTLTFWKPQRRSIEGAESDGFRDMGHLHYGISSGEYTCGGFFSELSGSLSEASSYLGTGGSPLTSAGANLWPLTDSSDDQATDPANTLSFKVDLSECLSRAGESAGVKQITLTAAGENLSGGANRAAITFWVSVP